MTNLSRHPVLRAIYGASQAIEKCGASRELTDAVMAVTALYAPAEGLLDHIASLERQLLLEQWNRRSTIASLERQLEDAKARAESAERALAEARKDQGRMDWLAARPREATIRIGADMKPCTFWGISSSRTDMRAAIDSAIEAEKGARNVRD